MSDQNRVSGQNCASDRNRSTELRKSKAAVHKVHKDWFLPAIESDGSVRRSFDEVLAELRLRVEFIQQLRERLTRKGVEIDNLTDLGRRAKELENTLRFRLGLLQPDRTAAWFRKATTKDYGPFRSTMLVAPVFAPYDGEDVDRLSAALQDCWLQCKTGPLPFQEAGENLWGELLGLRAELESMAALKGAFQSQRLDRPVEGLPSCLESATLRAFLLNVCAEFVSVRDRLQLCFDHLWSASEKFWAHQRQQNRVKSHSRANYKRASPPPPRNPMRELGISYAEMEALRYMGFQQRPSSAELKTRYFEMAKQLHPDRLGGNEESFKMLNKAYTVLKRPGRVEPAS